MLCIHSHFYKFAYLNPCTVSISNRIPFRALPVFTHLHICHKPSVFSASYSHIFSYSQIHIFTNLHISANVSIDISPYTFFSCFTSFYIFTHLSSAWCVLSQLHLIFSPIYHFLHILPNLRLFPGSAFYVPLFIILLLICTSQLEHFIFLLTEHFNTSTYLTQYTYFSIQIFYRSYFLLKLRVLSPLSFLLYQIFTHLHISPQALLVLPFPLYKIFTHLHI